MERRRESRAFHHHEWLKRTKGENQMGPGFPTEKEWLEMNVIDLFLRGFFLLIGLAGIITSLGLVAYQVVKDIPSASVPTFTGATIFCCIPTILLLVGIGGISLWRKIQ